MVHALAHAPKLVAVVDDDPAVLSSIEFLLGVQGREALAFRSAEDALADPRVAQADFLIVDWKLPGADGLSLISQLRARGVGAPAIVIAGMPTARCRRKAAELGAPVVEKPLMGDAIGNWLGWLMKRGAEADDTQQTMETTMPRRRKVLFVLADGGRARFVVRAADTGAYVTLEELEAPPPARAGPKTAVFQSMGHGRSTTEPSSGAQARSNAAFLKRVGLAAAAAAAHDGCDGLVLVAPARLMKPLREAVGDVPIIGELAKDLTKVPNHELGAWLRPAELSGAMAG